MPSPMHARVQHGIDTDGLSDDVEAARTVAARRFW